jgi:oxygen-independent coproporphyrinogen-3 oxidase
VSFGVYVHFPYCRAKCPYCDFAVHVVREIPHQGYGDAVLRELALRAPGFERFGPLRSVAFGGGSPSLWEPSCVQRVLTAIREAFPSPSPLEVSLEVNPEDLTADGFKQLRDLGITRASIGVQSFDDAVLVGLGRAHGAQAARQSVAWALAAGFESVSLDLIYGGPGQTEAIAQRDAHEAVESGVSHVSSYALTLEELAVDVPMAKWVRQGRVEVATPDRQADFGQVVRETLQTGGLERYEISNFAKAGAESVHNLGYWIGEPYLGLGVGAFGADRILRYGNTRQIAPYLEALGRGELPPGERDALGPDSRLREHVFLGLRLVRGLSLSEVATEFGAARAMALRLAAAPMLERGLAELSGDRLHLTDAGMDLHSEIAARLMPEK